MSPSRTSICTGSLRRRALAAGAVALATCALVACHGKKRAIARLTQADGPVDRQAGQSTWRSAAIGTDFYVGDAARTADGGARLALLGNARLAMRPHTILRFVDHAGAAKLTVELGAVELSSTGGSYGLELGKVELAQDSSIRIAAHGTGKNTVELLVGAAQLTPSDGKAVALEIGKIVDLSIGPVEVHPVIDAGVVAAADAASPPDAAPVLSDAVEIAVTGRHAQTLAPGHTRWQPLPQGAGTIAKGTRLRLGTGTTAKLVSGTTTLELAAGARTRIGDDLLLGLELGSATASVPAAQTGKVGVPGGAVELTGSPQGPGLAKLEVNARGEARVDVLRGSAMLDGAPGTALDLRRGETAALAKAGTIHVIEAIPTTYDFAVTIGETPSFTIHDPRGATALRFDFGGKCPGGGVIELDHDARFRTAKLSSGKGGANIMVTAGSWHYRLRCTAGDREGAAVASGRIAVVRDSGRRRLPPRPGKDPIDADGRNYTISYQSLIPIVEVHYHGTGARFRLHLATGGAEQTFDSARPVFEVPGAKLEEATYTFWVDHDGVKQDKVSTLKINFDQTAPQVYIESPPNGRPFGKDIEVRGAVLPGWTAKVAGVEIPVDPRTRRFHATVQPPPGTALAIRLAHARRGVHFYLRRPK